MKKTVSKILMILLSLLMTLSTFGCLSNTSDKAEDHPTTVFAANGESSYSIVYPDGIDEDLFKHLLEFKETIQNVTGASLEIKNDFSLDQATESDKKEILIGNTARSQSKEVMDTLGYLDYAVRTVDRKIVIAAHTEKQLLEALERFMSEGLISSDGSTFTVGEDVLYTSEIKGFFETYGNPSEYRLVYPRNQTELKAYAENIAVTIRKKYQLTLPVVSDEELPNGYEILIGSTNRAVFEDYYRGKKAPDYLHYSICAREGNLLIMGGGERANRLACERFVSDFMDTFYSYRLELPYNYEKTLVAYERDDDSARTVGTDLRIMSYNILSKELSPDAADFSERAELVLATMLNYLPDVIGVQEVSEKAYGILEQELGAIYAVPETKTPNGQFSYTGLMYNKNTVKYIDGGNILYSVGNKRIRLMSWGLFERRGSERRFCVVNTHWDIVKEQRAPQSVEMTSFVNQLISTYQCPVFTTGDFNTLESTPYYKQYLSNTGQVEARYAAKEVGFALSEDVIDHITATEKDTETLFFKLLKTDLTKQASDHDPIYADYKFKN